MNRRKAINIILCLIGIYLSLSSYYHLMQSSNRKAFVLDAMSDQLRMNCNGYQTCQLIKSIRYKKSKADIEECNNSDSKVTDYFEMRGDIEYLDDKLKGLQSHNSLYLNDYWIAKDLITKEINLSYRDEYYIPCLAQRMFVNDIRLANDNKFKVAIGQDVEIKHHKYQIGESGLIDTIETLRKIKASDLVGR